MTGLGIGAWNLDIALKGVNRKSLPVGQWFPSEHHPDVYASVITLAQVDAELLKSHQDRAKPIWANNGAAQQDHLVYLVGFSLDRYTLGWMHGTEHPGVGWSRRYRLKKDNPRGPEGFSKLRPLEPVGAVSPHDVPFVIGTFSGGFQRRHGAFKRGERAKTLKGHHYGFIEDGVVLSSLQPSLATVVVYMDGLTEVRDWTLADQARLPQIRYARQNGVPLIEEGGPQSVGIPGKLVGDRMQGNWSGSVEKQLMTPRAAGCLVEEGGHRLFVYAYFSGHTPSGMARVLQAYRCDYAIHLDMNSAGQGLFFTVYQRQRCGRLSGRTPGEIDGAGGRVDWQEPDAQVSVESGLQRLFLHQETSAASWRLGHCPVAVATDRAMTVVRNLEHQNSSRL